MEEVTEDMEHALLSVGMACDDLDDLEVCSRVRRRLKGCAPRIDPLLYIGWAHVQRVCLLGRGCRLHGAR